MNCRVCGRDTSDGAYLRVIVEDRVVRVCDLCLERADEGTPLVASVDYMAEEEPRG